MVPAQLHPRMNAGWPARTDCSAHCPETHAAAAHQAVTHIKLPYLSLSGKAHACRLPLPAADLCGRAQRHTPSAAKLPPLGGAAPARAAGVGKLVESRGSRPGCEQVPSAAETWEHLEALLEGLLAGCRISAVASWRQLQAFLHAFRERQPGDRPPRLRRTSCVDRSLCIAIAVFVLRGIGAR